MKTTFIVLCFLFSACTSIPIDSHSRDQWAKQFQPDPNFARIYIYRNKFIGGLFNYPILVNNHFVGYVSSSTYQMIIVKEGTYSIKETYGWPAEHSLQARKGRLYFVFIDTGIGFLSPNISVDEVSESEGKDAIQSRHLARRERIKP